MICFNNMYTTPACKECISMQFNALTKVEPVCHRFNMGHQKWINDVITYIIHPFKPSKRHNHRACFECLGDTLPSFSAGLSSGAKPDLSFSQ